MKWRLKRCSCGDGNTFEWEDQCPSCSDFLFVRDGEARFDFSTFVCHASYDSNALPPQLPEVVAGHFHEGYHYLQFGSSSYGLLWAFASSVQAHDVRSTLQGLRATSRLEVPLQLEDEWDFERLEYFKRVTLFGGQNRLTIGQAFDVLGIERGVTQGLGWDCDAKLSARMIFEPNAVKAANSWLFRICGIAEVQRYNRAHAPIPVYSFARVAGDVLEVPRKTIDMLLDIALLCPVTPFMEAVPTKSGAFLVTPFAAQGAAHRSPPVDISYVLESMLVSKTFGSNLAQSWYGPVERFLQSLMIVSRDRTLFETEINDSAYLRLYAKLAERLDWPGYDDLISTLLAYSWMMEDFTPTKHGHYVFDPWNLEHPWRSYKAIFKTVFHTLFTVRKAKPAAFVNTIEVWNSTKEVEATQITWQFRDRLGTWNAGGFDEVMEQTRASCAFAFINLAVDLLVRGGRWRCPMAYCPEGPCCCPGPPILVPQGDECPGFLWFKLILDREPASVVLKRT